jgi:two-component system NtrC family sensor kinase
MERRAVQPPSPPATAAEVNRRILLIDDNPAIHDDFRKILNPAASTHPELDAFEAELFDAPMPPAPAPGFELHSAFQGQEGLARLRRARAAGAPYAAAFVDVRMPPGWDGIETVSRLWREDPELQVVICTAYSDQSWAEITERLAPGDGLIILRKPFDNAEIRQLAHALTTKWMEQRRARSERARLERELRLAHRLEAVGLVAAGIAHEISTPVHYLNESARMMDQSVGVLLGALGELRGLVARAADDPAALRAGLAELDRRPEVRLAEQEAREGLTGTLEAAERINGVIRAMREFVYPDPAEKQPTDLNRALLNTLTVARHEYKYVAEVVTDLEELPAVVCHAGDLNQVFLNLVVNAAQAIAEVAAETRQLGRITIRSRRDGDDVHFSFSDTGPGIPEAVQARLFEPFFTTKKRGQGTGQGLPLCRAMVEERHGGQIWFDSAPGRGATFHVRIPIEPRPRRDH